jgi:hypothetical protein
VGAAAPPTDVDTTGSSQEIDPLAATTAPEDWTQNPYVQLEGGFLAGVSLGLVPFGGVGQQLADAGELLPHGTPEARLGLAIGQIVGGIAITVGGFTGEVLGGAATVTGIGAAVGVPAMVGWLPSGGTQQLLNLTKIANSGLVIAQSIWCLPMMRLWPRSKSSITLALRSTVARMGGER